MTDWNNSLSGDYRLVRTNRRTLSVSVDKAGVVTAHAPLRMPLWQIERFLTQKAGWVQQKRQIALNRAKQINQYRVIKGGKLPYLGQEITVDFWNKKTAALEDGTLYLPETGAPVRQAVKWFRAQAAQVLTLYVEKWSELTGIRPEKLSFGHAGKRWGSMNSKGEMRLNIALLHCPPAYIHYVVVHELTHRLHMNHSPAFHACVETFYPGAAQVRKLGKSLAGMLSLLRENE